MEAALEFFTYLALEFHSLFSDANDKVRTIWTLILVNYDEATDSSAYRA